MSPNLSRHKMVPSDRPVSVRPPLSQNAPFHLTERPHTAMGNQNEFSEPFERNTPLRKSGGILSRLKKSFGKGKSKRDKFKPKSGREFTKGDISGPTNGVSSVSHSPTRDSTADSGILQFHSASDPPPDIWLSGRQPNNPEIAKPVPRKPPRRSRSKSNSGANIVNLTFLAKFEIYFGVEK